MIEIKKDKINDKAYFPSSSSFDYEQFPFYWIARLESLYKQEMEKTLKTIGMDTSRWRVGLLLREHQELSISEIANKALGKISTITKIVQRMEKEKLVSVYRQASDGRVRLVALTNLGKSQVDDIVATTKILFERVFSDFSSEEIEAFVTLSKRLFQQLEAR